MQAGSVVKVVDVICDQPVGVLQIIKFLAGPGALWAGSTSSLLKLAKKLPKNAIRVIFPNMKFLRRPLILFCGMLITSWLPAASSGISAGIAVVDITPPLGGQRLGYASPPPSDGVNHPITARVLVLASGETTVALVTWDLCVAGSPWLHAQMKELGIDQLLLHNTHTHSGPNLDEENFPSKDDQLRAATERISQAARAKCMNNVDRPGPRKGECRATGSPAK